MKQFATAIFGSLLTALYWWIVFTMVYANALFSGDRDPSIQPPPDGEVLARSGVTIVIGILVYAVLTIVWRRLIARFTRVTR